jgi:hypothetical protein
MKRGGAAWTAQLPVTRQWPVLARIRSRAAYLDDTASPRAGMRGGSGRFSDRFNCTPYVWSNPTLKAAAAEELTNAAPPDNSSHAAAGNAAAFAPRSATRQSIGIIACVKSTSLTRTLNETVRLRYCLG